MSDWAEASPKYGEMTVVTAPMTEMTVVTAPMTDVTDWSHDVRDPLERCGVIRPHLVSLYGSGVK